MKARRLFSLFALLVWASTECGAESGTPAPKQFLGILHLVERLHVDTAWTKEDGDAVERHFLRLKDEAKKRKLIFAGRTLEAGDKTIGLVVFEAADMHDAEEFMAADPTVLAGVMKAEVHPYQIAVARD